MNEMIATNSNDLMTFSRVEKYFPVLGGVFRREINRVRVLNGIDLEVRRGEILGLVGESGCGKSTLAKLALCLLPPSSGEIRFNGLDLATITATRRKEFYRQVQMVFQDPYSSLNPRHRVKNIIGEMLRVHGVSRAEEEERVQRILAEVGLSEPGVQAKYPHEFSGGQRQRIAIARALILRPKLLLADEPVSALDLAIQQQILELLLTLKEKFDLTILFVSHDLKKVQGFCDRVAVMYLGRIVELLPARRLFASGCHPYLQGLLASIPAKHPSGRCQQKKIIVGEPPSPLALPPGCFFHPRCPRQLEICRRQRPLPVHIAEDHTVACHLFSAARDGAR